MTNPLDGQVATPMITPSGGSFQNAVTVTITCATAGAAIRYTTDGSSPAGTSSLYSGPFELNSSATVKARAYKEGMTESVIASSQYTVNYSQTVATPTFSPPGGTYTAPQSISINCATAGASIHYTTNGSEPSQSSTQYSATINVSSTTTLKAKAFKSNYNASSTASATYIINLPSVATPEFSLSEGVYTMYQTVSISCSTSLSAIRYTTNGSEPNETSTLYSSPISITNTTTLKAKAYKIHFYPSSIASATYIIDLPPMILVTNGTFTMGDTRGQGDSDELPAHEVTLNSFYIGKYEVTQCEWQMMMGYNPTSGHGVGLNYPVYNVSWYAILKYCNLRSLGEGLTPVYTISGTTNPANWGAVPTSLNNTWNSAACDWYANGYRLPTEAEWEYAARGMTNNPDYLYSGSDSAGSVAWYYSNSDGTTHQVGNQASNGTSTHDMSGNVWEWCWDWYSSSYYSNSPINNPKGPLSGSNRLLRGGGWNYSASGCRVSYRNYSYPYYGYNDLGFRLCRTAD